MLLLTQSKKIALIALSLFLISLSVVFVVSSQQGGPNHELVQNNVFASFFSGGESKPASEIESIQDPVLVLTNSGEFSNLNSAFAEQFGYSRDFFIKEKFFALVQSEDLSNFIGTFTKVVSEKSKEVYSGPFRLKVQNGNYHLVILSMTANKNSVQIQFKDITDSVQQLEQSDAPAGTPIKDLENKDHARIVVEKP